MIYLVNHYLLSRVCIPHVNMFFSRRVVDSVEGLYRVFAYFYGPLVPQVENSADIGYGILRDNVGRWEGIRRGSGRGLYFCSR